MAIQRDNSGCGLVIVWIIKIALVFLGVKAIILSVSGGNINQLIVGIISIFIAFPFRVINMSLKGVNFILKKLLASKKNNNTEDVIPYNSNEINLETNMGTLKLQNPYRGVFIMGSNGSGKSESVGNPILKEFVKKDFCGILYDYKFPVLTKIAYEYTTEVDKYRVKIINIDDPIYSHKCNPIAPKYLKNSSYVREFSSAIINNLIKESIQKQDFWIRSSTDLLTSVIWFLKEEHPEICDLPHAMALVTSDISKLLKCLQKNDFCAQTARSIIDAYNNSAQAQLMGVVGTLQSAIGQINTPEICYVLSEDSSDLDINREDNKTLLCLANNPSLSKTFAPIYSLIVTVCLKQMNQQGKHKSFIFLDEAPTLFIPEFDQVPNTARSNKIATVYMLQDYSQMVDMFGPTKADVIFGALNNHFYGRLSSSKTAEMVSKQFGKYDKTFTVESSSSSLGQTNETGLFGSTGATKGYSENESRSTSQNVQERSTIPPHQFLEFNSGQFTGVFVDSNIGKISAPTNFQWYPEDSKIQYDHRKLFTEPEQVDAIKNYYRKVREDINLILG